VIIVTTEEYLRSARTLSQEEVDEREAQHDRARGPYVAHDGGRHVFEEARH